jgi:CheY-like chemotaxis protein/tetratricopeptide (TPR) repeat protein
MNVEAQLTTLKNQSADLTLAGRAELSCRTAKHLEKIGEYEAGCEALAEFWPDRNGPPSLDDLSESTKAEILLRAGALAGWLGGADQATGSQETAKNLITKSIEIFEGLGQSEEADEARGELALCYWREGSYDEARIHLAEALSRLSDEKSDLRAVLLIRAGIVEVDTQRFDQALRFYHEAIPLVEGSQDHALKGGFHIAYGLVFRRLAAPENREDYMDRALIEYAAASFHFEEAGNERALARVENNLGYLFFTIGRYKDAHSHLDRARHLFLELKDVGTAAQVDDTRARTLLAQDHVAEAERLARSAVRVLERGGQQAVLAEALATQGVALARLGNARAKTVLERAIDVAETTGDSEGAGRTKLSIIEELGEKIPAKELISFYRAAVEQLKDSQDPSTGKRLITCADKLLDTVARLDGEDEKAEGHTWEGFSLKQHVHDGERAVIERALRDAGGSVTRAARLLGFRHHQSLVSVINSRHKELLKTRSPVRKRRQHLFSPPRKIEKKKAVKVGPQPATSEISILHVEDNKVVARLIQDTLGAEGMHVDSCISGATALEVLKGVAPYDAIIIDNNLPGLSGLELVLRVRSMDHRRNTPIIMLSGDDCEKEAWRAGVHAFLRKPEDVEQVSSTIERLLDELKERGD